MNNNNYRREHFIIDKDEIKKMPDKECCLVCSIIICYNITFIGIMFSLIKNEDLNSSLSS